MTDTCLCSHDWADHQDLGGAITEHWTAGECDECEGCPEYVKDESLPLFGETP